MSRDAAMQTRLGDGDLFACGQVGRFLALGLAVECERNRWAPHLVSVHACERRTEGPGRLLEAAWAERRGVQLDGTEHTRPGVWVRP